MKALELRVGKTAAKRLEDEGWHADLIDGLIGASGGPKWLILGRMDRVLISDLLAKRSRPLDAVGSSIGSWRHAAMAQPDPVEAYDRFEKAYLTQKYKSKKPTVPEITEVALWLMRSLLGEGGERHVAEHPWLRSHIVTARGKGLNSLQPGKRLIAGMGAAALGNALSRSTLPASFQRVVFASQQATPLSPLLDGFATQYVDLSEANVFNALMASGAIPYVFASTKLTARVKALFGMAVSSTITSIYSVYPRTRCGYIPTSAAAQQLVGLISFYLGDLTSRYQPISSL